jgi:hypothetical protein
MAKNGGFRPRQLGQSALGLRGRHKPRAKHIAAKHKTAARRANARPGMVALHQAHAPPAWSSAVPVSRCGWTL